MKSVIVGVARISFVCLVFAVSSLSAARSNDKVYAWYESMRDGLYDYTEHSYGLRLPKSIETLIKKRLAPYDKLLAIGEFAYLRKGNSDICVLVVVSARFDKVKVDDITRVVVLKKSVHEPTWKKSKCYVFTIFPSVLKVLSDPTLDEVIELNASNSSISNRPVSIDLLKEKASASSNEIKLPTSALRHLVNESKNVKHIHVNSLFMVRQQGGGMALGVDLSLKSLAESETRRQKYILNIPEGDSNLQKAKVREVALSESFLDLLEDERVQNSKKYPGLSSTIDRKRSSRNANVAPSPHLLNVEQIEALWLESSSLLKQIENESEKRMILRKLLEKSSGSQKTNNVYTKLLDSSNGVANKKYYAVQVELINALRGALEAILKENKVLKKSIKKHSSDL